MVTPQPTKDICPECQADRNVVRELLEDDKGSDNWEIGRVMLKNCKACREALIIIGNASVGSWKACKTGDAIIKGGRHD